MESTVCIIMRCHNDMPVLAKTLAGLRWQDRPYRLIALDNASTDGSRELLLEHGAHLIDVPAGQYVPGRVLNQGVAVADSDIVVFLNSDCTPADRHWLSNLLEPFNDADVAAVFGRQMPRRDCLPWYARDTDDTFGDGSRQARWRHCFSLASSAMRRSVWQSFPFDERLQYSEDIDLSWRLVQHGYRISYVATSAVLHSHNYSLTQFYRRHRGEGMAEAHIFSWSPWERSFLRYSLLPYGRQVWHDIAYCLRREEIGAAIAAPLVRMAQLLGRRAGLRAGLRHQHPLLNSSVGDSKRAASIV